VGSGTSGRKSRGKAGGRKQKRLRLHSFRVHDDNYKDTPRPTPPTTFCGELRRRRRAEDEAGRHGPAPGAAASLQGSARSPSVSSHARLASPRAHRSVRSSVLFVAERNASSELVGAARRRVAYSRGGRASRPSRGTQSLVRSIGSKVVRWGFGFRTVSIKVGAFSRRP